MADITRKEQHIEHRAFLYRLNIPENLYDNAAAASKLDKSLIKRFFIINIEDLDFETFAKIMEEKFDAFKTAINKLVFDVITLIEQDENKDVSKFIEEIEITALIDSVTTDFSIYGKLNSFTVNLINPKVDPRIDIRVDDPVLKEKLLNLEFRELDFIKVTMYCTDESKDLKLQKLFDKSISNLSITDRIKARIRGPRSDKKFIDAFQQFFFRPFCAGFITAITKTVKDNQVSTSTLSCQGVFKLFASTVTVTSSSTTNVYDNIAKSGIKLINTEQFNINQTRFAEGQTAEKVFSFIIDELLLGKRFTGDSFGNISVDSIKDAVSQVDPTIGDRVLNTSTIHPMIHIVLLLFLVKRKFTEPLYAFDDEFFPIIDPNSDSKEGYDLKPYQQLIRTSYELWEPQYESPIKILTDVSSNTFYEIYEDRAGVLHFRRPRYNESIFVQDIKPSVIETIEFNKTDSNLYSMSQAKNVVDYIPGLSDFPGSIRINKFISLRYGIRAPTVISNPNVMTDKLGAKFGQVYEEFNNYASRSATITKAGEPFLNIGDNVFVRFDDITDDRNGYICYTTQLRENYQVGVSYSQTLYGTFFRRTFRSELKKEDFVEDLKINIIALPIYIITSLAQFADLSITDQVVSVFNSFLSLKEDLKKDLTKSLVTVPVNKELNALVNTSYLQKNVQDLRDISKFLQTETPDQVKESQDFITNKIKRKDNQEVVGLDQSILDLSYEDANKVLIKKIQKFTRVKNSAQDGLTRLQGGELTISSSIRTAKLLTSSGNIFIFTQTSQAIARFINEMENKGAPVIQLSKSFNDGKTVKQLSDNLNLLVAKLEENKQATLKQKQNIAQRALSSPFKAATPNDLKTEDTTQSTAAISKLTFDIEKLIDLIRNTLIVSLQDAITFADSIIKQSTQEQTLAAQQKDQFFKVKSINVKETTLADTNKQDALSSAGKAADQINARAPKINND